MILYGHLLWALTARGLSGAHLSETERAVFKFIIILVVILLLFWVSTILIRYYYREQMIRKKMKWSYSNDSFWNYDTIIKAAQNNYTKAQMDMQAPGFFKKLKPVVKAALLPFKKGIRTEIEMEFLSSYIVCFDDKKVDLKDSVAVYIKGRVGGKWIFEEIVIMHRNGNYWKITEYVKNPTMFMISHSPSIVEKH